MMMPIRMGGWEDKIILHDRTSGQCQLPIGNSRALLALLAPFLLFFLAPADIDERLAKWEEQHSVYVLVVTRQICCFQT